MLSVGSSSSNQWAKACASAVCRFEGSAGATNPGKAKGGLSRATSRPKQNNPQSISKDRRRAGAAAAGREDSTAASPPSDWRSSLHVGGSHCVCVSHQDRTRLGVPHGCRRDGRIESVGRADRGVLAGAVAVDGFRLLACSDARTGLTCQAFADPTYVLTSSPYSEPSTRQRGARGRSSMAPPQEPVEAEGIYTEAPRAPPRPIRRGYVKLNGRGIRNAAADLAS